MKKNYLQKITFLFVLFCSGFLLQGQSNQYLHFDGVDDYTELPAGAQYVNNLNTISMAGWFYTDALVYGQGMMSIRGGGTGDGEMYLIQLNNGTMECRLITTTGLHEVVAPAGTIQAGVWQHIAWVFDQNTVELFVDGVSIGSGSASGTFQSSDRPFSIGKCIQSGFNFVFGGRADEVSLWSKALTATEIQNMIANELVGDEAGLEVYYKFDQGTPAGDNTNITQLLAEGGQTEKNSNLMNFALTGTTSNFGGTLESGFQVINLLPIPNKLTTDSPFELVASVTSGLDITFEIVSGPATVSGNMVTLTGAPGEVTVKASQPGNGTWDPAEDVFTTFEVLDPNGILVDAQILHPLAGDVFAPSLIPLKIAINANIAYPELFSVGSVTAMIDGSTIALTDHGNGFYTGWWTPTAYGQFTLNVNSTNNYGASQQVAQTFNLMGNTGDITATATDEVWVNSDYPSKTVEADLPSFVGAFDQIMGTLYIECPTGGCDPWDRISSIEAQGKDGEWYEIIRYLTPYGVSCQSEIDLTDFRSILRGNTKFRVNLGTQGNGFLYTLELTYHAGTPTYPYSSVQKLWYQTYAFGDMANLQPAEDITAIYPANTQNAKIKLVSTGHGWGDTNTGNAAEFHEDTHHIWVNGTETFSQHNWNVCNPNPDSCSPQNGTWYYNRAGWCPGSIAQFFDYDMGSISQNSVDLQYIFDEDYVDYCHPNNPNCVTGTTCSDCDDGFNPHLIVSSYLVSFGASPLLKVKEPTTYESVFTMYPNPSTGNFYIGLKNNSQVESVVVYDNLGRSVKSIQRNDAGNEMQVNLTGIAPGVYLVSLYGKGKMLETKRLIIE
ncbi:MAG TPA: LamG-like jellyroll fold domain-containing protein [Flavobacteriaceae bacterium]|nr:LamG-like jellyroll fold domain-containing protein [Flavobacteriaceae bacterium]